MNNINVYVRQNSTRQYNFEKFKKFLSKKYSANTAGALDSLLARLVSTKDTPGMINTIDHLIKNVTITVPETCPNLDDMAVSNVEFKKLCGRWDAIYTSNSRVDKDCVYTVDSYHKAMDSLIQEKQVIMRRSKSSPSRQEVLYDRTFFQSWILDTDYKTYRLQYTCYVKVVNGRKRRIDLQRLYTKNIEAKDFDPNILARLRQKSSMIDLQRLYTKNIEAKDFDPNILARLRQKSSMIGKALEPMDRLYCPPITTATTTTTAAPIISGGNNFNNINDDDMI
ncbi:unnamed protein product [Medioppia subpectinata]|uniref:Uncharacterized protein n=1 Tax=Medioppia subpectinata TaxID=1979941 RepID=A0A7R9PY91_9ACAR|nr:unnamed protein product [Medioppia subpectinata]CAG2105151.1 unnamed protein product [Medioppia subpectinata]